ncbi:ADP-ribosylation factor GTPase-activating protein AGD3-like protein [Tanacetum coccineum]|uniref:ADP-ribosylation factor GTPase-activating protein AGD3-like protein n=1 Tax=Tanacetum coccineum TaxID=301880 RepID=A0ABQ5FVV8_9ASTR
MVAGPDMIKFAHVLKELGTSNENLGTQVSNFLLILRHTLSDRLLRFGNVELQDIKEVRKRFDKADVVYSQIRGKYLSLRKSTLTEIASAIEEMFSCEGDNGSATLLLYDFSENESTNVDIMFPAKPHTLLSELSNEVGFPVTNTSFDALLDSPLSTAKLFPQSAGYRILAS